MDSYGEIGAVFNITEGVTSNKKIWSREYIGENVSTTEDASSIEYQRLF